MTASVYRYILSGKFQVIGYEDESVCLERDNGDRVWMCKGQRHRINGSAVEKANGYRAWFYEGLYHRENGPAVEWENGNKYWYYKGQQHREDGPAVVMNNGKTMLYYHRGRKLPKEKWEKIK